MRRFAAVVVLGSLIGGCVSAEGKKVVSAHYDTWSGTKVLLKPECPLTPVGVPGAEVFPALVIPLLAAVAKPVVELSLNALMDFLKRQKEAYTATSEGKAAGDFYTVSTATAVTPTYGCLVLVRGTFGGKIGHEEPAAENEIRWTRANLQKIGLSEPPALYMELRMSYLGGTPPTHMTLRPVLVDYLQTAAEKTGVDGAKDLLVVVTFNTVELEGTDLKGSTFAAFSVALHKTRIGSRLGLPALNGLASDVQRLPLPTRREGDIPDLAPFHALVTLTETENAGAFYTAAAAALADNKDKLAKEIVAILDKLVQPPGGKPKDGGTK